MVGRWLPFFTRHSGVSLSFFPAPSWRRCVGERHPPPEVCMSQSALVYGTSASLRRTAPWGAKWGQLDGPMGPAAGARALRFGIPKVGRFRAPLPSDYPALFSEGLPACAAAPSGRAAKVRMARIVTWLILPVVICLSQRLSHACLSISNLYCETANGSLNQLSFI